MLNAAKKFTDDQPVLFAGVAATLIVGTAFASQFIGGLAPCDLCWWQRYPYFVAMGVALLGTAFKAIPQKFTLLLLALIFLVDAGIAGFHVGVEQRWWEGLSTCSSVVGAADSVDAAFEAIMNAPVIRCDEIAWSLFGISMAGYNMIAAAALAIFCIKKAQKAK